MMNTTLYLANKEVSDAEERAIAKIEKCEATSLAERIAAKAASLYHAIEISKTWAHFYDVACVSKDTINAEIENRLADDPEGFFGDHTKEAVIEHFKKQCEHYNDVKRERQIRFDTLMEFVKADDTAKEMYNNLLYHDADYWAFIHRA